MHHFINHDRSVPNSSLNRYAARTTLHPATGAGQHTGWAKKERDVINEFKAFLLRGNVIDLAVAVVIGAAFGAIVNSLVTDIITPLLGAIGGSPDFSEIVFTIRGSDLMIGLFINALISFVIIAAVIFFLVVKPMNAVMTRMKPAAADDTPTTKQCPECLTNIPSQARRCPACTSVLADQGTPA